MVDSERSSAVMDREEGTLRQLAAVVLLLLGVQFLTGMVTNLFVTIPSSHPGWKASHYFTGAARGVVWALAHGGPALAAHVTGGLLLLLVSVAILVIAARVRRRPWVWASLLGWIGVTGAGFNGASFVNYGHDFSSLLMSLAFILAVVSYASALYLSLAWRGANTCGG